jgi:hypothetical protein
MKAIVCARSGSPDFLQVKEGASSVSLFAFAAQLPHAPTQPEGAFGDSSRRCQDLTPHR